jgi:hypothetical protein
MGNVCAESVNVYNEHGNNNTKDNSEEDAEKKEKTRATPGE